MDGERLKRIVSAGTIMGVVLLLVLITVLVWQMVVISNTKSRMEKLEQEIVELEEQKKQTQDQIDLWLTEWKIEDRARELGWLKEDDR